MVTRRDLRAERDFYSPMTGDKSSTYGSQVRSRLEDIKNVKSTRTKPIEAVFAKLLKTADPFTQIEEKKSYAPQEENDIGGQIEGAVGAAQDAIGEGVSKVQDFARSTGQRAAKRRAEQQAQRATERAADKAEFNKRLANVGTSFDKQLGDFRGTMGTQSERLAENERLLSAFRTDSDMYRKTSDDRIQNISNTFTRDLKGFSDATGAKFSDYKESIGALQKANIDFGQNLKDVKAQVDKVKDDARVYRGQGGLKLGATTIRQGGAVVDGKYVGPQERGPAINASGLQQKNVRGSTSFGGTGKDESARPKQTVASLPSNYKSTEQKAFAAAKAYKSMTSGANVGSGAQANKGTGKDGGFGTGTYGSGRPSDKKTAPKKATPAQKTAVKKATTVKKSSPSPSSSGRKSNTGSKKSSRGSKSGGSKSGGSKSGGSKSGGSKSGGSKSNSGSKKSSRGAKGSSSSSSRGGTSRGPSRRTNTRRSRRRCDIRCKFDISVLTNLNLIKDDLADVAYFVRELQEE